MFRLFLVNMPFAALNTPSIGLTQLQSALHRAHADRIEVRILYINHDFAHYMGVQIYQRIATSMEHLYSGLGDWFFRQVAFQGVSDNSERYFRRYYPRRDHESQSFRDLVIQKRESLDRFMEELLLKYGLHDAHMVGFTSLFAQNVACFAMARKLKERNAGLITVMGGWNCESAAGRAIARNVEAIDFVFSGPAIENFPKLVERCLESDQHEVPQIADILKHDDGHTLKDVYSKTNCDGDVSDPDHENDMGIDAELALELDYDDFLNNLDTSFSPREVEPFLLLETSRGCWWGENNRCTFCGLNRSRMKYRPMSAHGAIKQFDAIFRYADRCSLVGAVDNILPKTYIRDVFPLLKTPSNLHIYYEVRSNLTDEDLRVLSRARVNVLQPGIESLATSTLTLMRKGTTAFRNLSLLLGCVRQGIYADWNLLVGFPGEGEEVYKKYIRDLPLLTHLPPPSGVYPVRFDRFSSYFTNAAHYGLDLHPYDCYALIYPFDEESVGNIAYFFMDHNLRAPYFQTMVHWIEKIRAIFKHWWALWHGENAGSPPRLFLERKGEKTVVYDTRSGVLVEHEIAHNTVELLGTLRTPRRAPGIFGQEKPFLEADLTFLRERGIVFEEGEHIMSLVLPEAPPSMSFLEKGLRRNSIFPES